MKWMAAIYQTSNKACWNPTVSSTAPADTSAPSCASFPLLPILLSSAAAASSVCQTLALHSRSSPERERSRARGGAAAALTPGRSSDGCPRACTGAMTPQLPSSGLGRRGGGRLASIQPRTAQGGWSLPKSSPVMSTHQVRRPLLFPSCCAKLRPCRICLALKPCDENWETSSISNLSDCDTPQVAEETNTNVWFSAKFLSNV